MAELSFFTLSQCPSNRSSLNNDLEMDSGAAEDGVMDTGNEAAVALEKVNLCQYSGDDNDLEMDCGAAEDGVMDTRNQSAVSCEKVNLCQYSGLTPLLYYIVFPAKNSIRLLV